jgi:hypothetical protein
MQKRLFTVLVILVTAAALAACNKQRCPDFSEDLLGTYAVNDSLLVPPEVEWYDRSYTIELTESGSGRHCVRIENFAFKNNTFTGEVFAVEAEIDLDVLTVVDQEVNGDVVRRSAGYFVQDSIYMDIEFENQFGEVFIGQCSGKKM